MEIQKVLRKSVRIMRIRIFFFSQKCEFIIHKSHSFLSDSRVLYIFYIEFISRSSAIFSVL